MLIMGLCGGSGVSFNFDDPSWRVVSEDSFFSHNAILSDTLRILLNINIKLIRLVRLRSPTGSLAVTTFLSPVGATGFSGPIFRLKGAYRLSGQPHII